MLGLVGGHQLDHLVEERLFVLRLVQVDEVDDDNAPQIAQAQLAGDLLRGRQVDVHGGLLLVVLGLGAVARIDIDDVHRLGVFDDQVGAAAQRDVLGEERLDLLRDVEVVEDRDVAPVKLDDLLLLGLDQADVIADVVVHRLVVDGDLRKRAVERIADDRIGAVHLAHQLRGRRTLLDRGAGLAPAVDLRLDVVLDVLVLGLHGRRADDDPEILGEHRSRDALQAFLLVRRADLLRKEHLGRKGHQYDVAAGQRNVGGQAGPLGRNGLLGDLHHDVLPDLKIVADLARLFDGRFELHALDAHSPLAGLLRSDQLLQRGKLASQVEVVDKSVLFVPDVYEGCIEPGHYLAYFPKVDISYGKTRLALLLVEFDKHLVLTQRNGDFCRVDVND